MNRRDFMKLGGITTLLLLFPVWKLAEFAFDFPEAEFNGKVYRGTPDGDIQVSFDQKKSWQKQVGFGSDLAIRQLFIRNDGRLVANIKYRDFSFELSLSENEKDWLVS